MGVGKGVCGDGDGVREGSREGSLVGGREDGSKLCLDRASLGLGGEGRELLWPDEEGRTAVVSIRVRG